MQQQMRAAIISLTFVTVIKLLGAWREQIVYYTLNGETTLNVKHDDRSFFFFFFFRLAFNKRESENEKKNTDWLKISESFRIKYKNEFLI